MDSTHQSWPIISQSLQCKSSTVGSKRLISLDGSVVNKSEGSKSAQWCLTRDSFIKMFLNSTHPLLSFQCLSFYKIATSLRMKQAIKYLNFWRIISPHWKSISVTLWKLSPILILLTRRIYLQRSSTDGDAKMNAQRVILWEVGWMIIQGWKKIHKFLKNILIWAVGFGSFLTL